MRKKNINYKYYSKDTIIIDYYLCRSCRVLKLVDDFDVNEYDNKYLNKKCRKCRVDNLLNINKIIFVNGNELHSEFVII